jgi:acyl carrier protein
MSIDDEIVEQLRREVASRAKVAPEKIDGHAHFLIDLGLSSLDLLSVLAFAEKTFSVRLPDEKLSELSTLENVAEAVRVHRSADT